MNCNAVRVRLMEPTTLSYLRFLLLFGLKSTSFLELKKNPIRYLFNEFFWFLFQLFGNFFFFIYGYPSLPSSRLPNRPLLTTNNKRNSLKLNRKRKKKFASVCFDQTKIFSRLEESLNSHMICARICVLHLLLETPEATRILHCTLHSSYFICNFFFFFSFSSKLESDNGFAFGHCRNNNN